MLTLDLFDQGNAVVSDNVPFVVAQELLYERASEGFLLFGFVEISLLQDPLRGYPGLHIRYFLSGFGLP